MPIERQSGGNLQKLATVISLYEMLAMCYAGLYGLSSCLFCEAKSRAKQWIYLHWVAFLGHRYQYHLEGF